MEGPGQQQLMQDRCGGRAGRGGAQEVNNTGRRESKRQETHKD